MSDFTQRDPQQAAFWDERFEQQFTPWDCGGVPQQLQHFLGASERPMITLIPGCGNGYEAAFLAQRGWPVTAIDFSPAAVVSARLAIGEWGLHVQQADFFSFEPEAQPELIIERAFFCALPPQRREAIVQRWSALLAEGALLAGYFFFEEDDVASKKGPPFSIARAAFLNMMAPFFELLEDRPVEDSLPVFAGRERWMVWRRKRAA